MALSASPSNLRFGDVIVGKTKSMAVTLTNSGAASATILQGRKAANPPNVNTPKKSLGQPNQTFSLSASPSSINFGNVNLGSVSTQSLTLQNTGTGSVTISQVTVTGAGFSFTSIPLPFTLLSGKGAAFNINFTPTVGGNATGTVSVVSNATTSPTIVSLSGFGLSYLLNTSPLSISFGNVNVGSSSTMQATLTNTGTGTVTVSQVMANGTGFSVSGVTTPLNIVAGTSYTFNVTFTPNTGATFSGSVTVTSNAAGSPISIPLSGSGLSYLLSTSSSLLAFGNVNDGSTSTQSLTVTNTGTGSVSISAATTTGAGFSVTGPALPYTLAAGTTTTFNVSFAPNTGTASNGSLTLTSNATNSPATVTLTGTGVSYLVTASPLSLAFGSVNVGMNATQSVKLTNSGTASVTITQITASGAGFTYSGITLPYTLAPGLQVNLNVTFTPISGTASSGTVTITSTASNSPATVSLSGTGLSNLALVASPTTINFGNVNLGSVSTQSVTVTNTGTSGPLTVTAATVTGAAFSISGIALPFTLQAGGSASFNAIFSPTAGGNATGTVSLTSSASSTPTKVSLSGFGLSYLLSVSPLSLNFGNVNVGSSSTLQGTLTNTGTGTVTVSQVMANGTGFSVSGVTTPLNIAAGTSVIFNVAFAPASGGPFSGTVSVTSNANGTPTSTISLSGTGLSYILNASTSKLSFGNVNDGTTATQTVTLTNAGTGGVNITQTTVTGAGFSVTGPGLPFNLSAGASTTFTVAFAPTTGTAISGSLTVTSNATNSPTTIALSGTGVSYLLTAAASSLNFGSVNVGLNTLQTLSVTNTGTGIINITQVTVSGLGFSISGPALPYTLAAGQKVSFNVTFAPSTGASVSGSVTITSTASNSPATVSLSGTGVSYLVSASPGSLSFGNVPSGISATQKVTVTNTGTASANITQVTVSGSGFSISGPTLPVTLLAGQNTTFNATFSPTAAGVFTGTLTISSTASNSPATVSLSGMGTTYFLNASPLSLNFGNAAVKSTGSLPVTLTNTGTASVTLGAATEMGAGFSFTGLSLPLTLAAGQSLTFSATYTPPAAGSFTGIIALSSNATNSPLTISLSGTSGAGTYTCTGSAITETPTDVTDQLTSVASGITVTQITNNGFDWNSYPDMPAYSSLANVLIYNYQTNPAAVASAKLDGSNAQVISGSAQGSNVVVSNDGEFAYYQGQNSNKTADMYAVPIAQSGTCTPIRLSMRNMTLVPPAPTLLISTSTIDPNSHRNVIAFSEGTILHRVLDNGTALADVTLGDPENTNPFHRLRLNPMFPNVMWYKRDQPLPNPDALAEPEIWIVNFTAPDTVYSLTGSMPADHPDWSNDGTKLGFIANGYWYVADVLKTNGTFNLNAEGAFTFTQVGPPGSSGFTVDFCSLSPDGTVYVCSQSYQSIYLMSLDGTQAKFLVAPDSNPAESIYQGIPKPRFLDMEHIMFTSDRTGTPELYVITGFTTTFP